MVEEKKIIIAKDEDDDICSLPSHRYQQKTQTNTVSEKSQDAVDQQ